MSSVYIPADIRRLVRARAKECCEYCRMPEFWSFVSHEVDHVVALKHGGDTIENNLALSCILCNKHKGSDLSSIDPVNGDLVALFHPRSDSWEDHFCIEGDQILPVTATGRVTVRLLQLNQRERRRERQVLIDAGLLE